MRRGRVLKERLESLRIRRQNRRVRGGYKLYETLTGIVALQRDMPAFDTGLQENTAMYRVNVSPPNRTAQVGDDLVRLTMLPNTADDTVINAKVGILTITDIEVHGTTQQFHCTDQQGRLTS